jgi:hypothetical protein
VQNGGGIFPEVEVGAPGSLGIARTESHGIEIAYHGDRGWNKLI